MDNLAPEIITYIMQYLNVRDISLFALTSKLNYDLLYDQQYNIKPNCKITIEECKYLFYKKNIYNCFNKKLLKKIYKLDDINIQTRLSKFEYAVRNENMPYIKMVFKHGNIDYFYHQRKYTNNESEQYINPFLIILKYKKLTITRKILKKIKLGIINFYNIGMSYIALSDMPLFGDNNVITFDDILNKRINPYSDKPFKNNFGDIIILIKEIEIMKETKYGIKFIFNQNRNGVVITNTHILYTPEKYQFLQKRNVICYIDDNYIVVNKDLNIISNDLTYINEIKELGLLDDVCCYYNVH